jgi:hypothetical protein
MKKLRKYRSICGEIIRYGTPEKLERYYLDLMEHAPAHQKEIYSQHAEHWYRLGREKTKKT